MGCAVPSPRVLSLFLGQDYFPGYNELGVGPVPRTLPLPFLIYATAVPSTLFTFVYISVLWKWLKNMNTHTHTRSPPVLPLSGTQQPLCNSPHPFFFTFHIFLEGESPGWTSGKLATGILSRPLCIRSAVKLCKDCDVQVTFQNDFAEAVHQTGCPLIMRSYDLN